MIASAVRVPVRALMAGLLAWAAIMPHSSWAQQDRPAVGTPLRLAPPRSLQPPEHRPAIPPGSVQPGQASPLPPAASPVSISPPATDKQAVPGAEIRVDSLQIIDPDSAGTLGEAQGGLGVAMWS